jgi:hypothetical protein
MRQRSAHWVRPAVIWWTSNGICEQIETTEHDDFVVMGDFVHASAGESHGHGSDGSQGNRVKNSCGDEACEEFVIPGGDFAAEADGILARGSSDQV